MKTILGFPTGATMLFLSFSAFGQQAEPRLSVVDLPRSDAEISGRAPALNHRGWSGKPVHVYPTSQGHEARASSGLVSTSNNLVYHAGGSIIPHVNVYTIYWSPASGHLQNGAATGMSANYKAVNNALGQAASSINYPNQFNTINGKTGSLFNIATQYYQIQNGVTTYVQNNAGATALAASWTDTSNYPPSGCSDSATPGNCLSDAQIQAEIQKAMTANGWQVGVNNVYLLYTSSGEGSCIASNSSVCSYTYYCGYHSGFDATVNGMNGVVLYANLPYGNASTCKAASETSPNDRDADVAVNVASHELMEMVTDPLGNAWFDRSGNEIGDKCNFNFGVNGVTDPVNGVRVNQYFSNSTPGAYFELQQEWSNAVNGCAQLR